MNKNRKVARLLTFLRKNPVLVLIGLILSALALLGTAADAVPKIFNTAKLFAKAKQDTDAISQIRGDLQKQKDGLDLLVHNSTVAYKEISDVRTIATGARTEIDTLGSLIHQAQDSLESAKTELARLKRRNQLAALADKAIGEGSVSAYKELDKCSLSPLSDDDRNAISAEDVRVITAYSFAAPTRIGSLKINASTLNPMKRTEEDLSVADIMPFLSPTVEPNGLARAKLAKLLSTKVKAGSYKTAEAVATAIRNEDHLEAIKELLIVFRAVTGFQRGDKPDGRFTLEWWDENRRTFQTKDTDKN